METALVAPNPGRGGTLTVLGCDGSYPGPGGAASGYLVEAQGLAVWLDAGPGTFAALQTVIDPRRLDAVVLSHEHPDHWTDLESFAVWCRQVGPGRPIPVYSPPGLRRRSYFGSDPVLHWQEVEPSYRIELRRHDGGGGRMSCSFCATDHGPPTLAVRFDPVELARAPGEPAPEAAGTGPADAFPDPSRALAYSADTGPDWSAQELGTGIGTLLCEATYTRTHEGELRHMSGRQAGAMAARAGVNRLIVTHRWPTVPADVVAAEADAAFGRPVHQASPGRRFEW